MPATVIVGAQWGDEGKGKITDYLAKDAHTIVRYQGGNNAGHTIVVDDTTYKFHLIPSGILHEDKVCLLGSGVVIDPDKLLSELDGLAEQGVDISRLKVSDQAHYILPTHKELDLGSESRRGDAKIGTTGRGIGPAYTDKASRLGVRMADPAYPEALRKKLAAHLEQHSAQLEGSEWTAETLFNHLQKAHERLKSHLCSAPHVINEALEASHPVIFEGAQGTLLDIDHGTYPFVTSSSPTAGGACAASGIGPSNIDKVIGIAKAYTTRVGSGPFPTEIENEHSEQMRKVGHEFGTTTGRPRRCGWLDLVALKYAKRINGLTHLVVTKLDVLDGFEEIKLCVGYRIGGQETTNYPTDANQMDAIEPIYETVRGWNTDTTQIRDWDGLPLAAQEYVTRIEAFVGAPVGIVSVGPGRDATIVRPALTEGS